MDKEVLFFKANENSEITLLKKGIKYLCILRDKFDPKASLRLDSYDKWEIPNYIIPSGLTCSEIIYLLTNYKFEKIKLASRKNSCVIDIYRGDIAVEGDIDIVNECKNIWEDKILLENIEINNNTIVRSLARYEINNKKIIDMITTIQFLPNCNFNLTGIKFLINTQKEFIKVRNIEQIPNGEIEFIVAYDKRKNIFIGYDGDSQRLITNGLSNIQEDYINKKLSKMFK